MHVTASHSEITSEPVKAQEIEIDKPGNPRQVVGLILRVIAIGKPGVIT